MAKITFTMPRGDAEFDELEPGEKMTVQCTIRKEGQDQACLVAVDGQTLEGYGDDEDSEEDESDEGDAGTDEEAEPTMMDAMDEQLG